jgi:integrase
MEASIIVGHSLLILKSMPGPYRFVPIGEEPGGQLRRTARDFVKCCIQTPKTRNAYRQVDVNAALANLLKALVGNRMGRPLSQTNLLRRSLHPILKELGVEKAGFHAMRRFRATSLRKQRAPEDLIKFWLGHAEQSVTDGYSKLAEDEEFRRQEAERLGTGFVVPAYEEKLLIPMRPKNSKERTVGVAA